MYCMSFKPMRPAFKQFQKEMQIQLAERKQADKKIN